MMEAELKKLEEEIRAQKTAFEKMGLQMPVFTKSVNFSTLANPMKIDYGGGDVYEFDGNERVIVTYATSRGSNTLATLEMTIDGLTANLKVKRVPYAGGSRWIIYNTPTYAEVGGNYQRVATNYTFTVRSAVDGTLDARMIWQ